MNDLTTLTRRPSIWFGNGRATIRLSAAESDSAISIIEHHVPYGDSPPLHIHLNEDEVFMVHEGTVRMRIAAVEMILRAGDVAVAPRGIPHSFRVETLSGARFTTICRGADFETLVVQSGRPAIAPGLPEAQRPDAGMQAALASLAAANGIEIIGAPLG